MNNENHNIIHICNGRVINVTNNKQVSCGWYYSLPLFSCKPKPELLITEIYVSDSMSMKQFISVKNWELYDMEQNQYFVFSPINTAFDFDGHVINLSFDGYTLEEVETINKIWSDSIENENKH